ncbi:MAG: hypothetical protein ACPKPY_05035, partial [Nitrososphaeraceae archaeon]
NDFSININGNDLDPSKIIGSSDIQSIMIKPGNYTISVDDTLGYKLLMSSGCSGVISEYSIKECVLTLDDQPIDTAKVKLNNILSSTSSSNNLTKSENINMNNMTSNNLTKSENINMNNMTSSSTQSDITNNKIDLRIITKIINNDGGTNTSEDFKLKITNEDFSPVFINGKSPFQKTEINVGEYEVLIENLDGYEITSATQCKGVVKESDRHKTCIFEINDISR